MPLYTRTGDDGTTALPASAGRAMRRVSKNDPRTDALGCVDELNAAIGWCLSESRRITHMVIGDMLFSVQNNLLVAGSMLAYLGHGEPGVSIPAAAISAMERDIDAICRDLPELKHFILPGGSELASRLHITRAVCRRAERAAMAAIDMVLGQTPPADLPAAQAQARAVGVYLNRLSDLLFALARRANRDAGESDIPWQPTR